MFILVHWKSSLCEPLLRSCHLLLLGCCCHMLPVQHSCAARCRLLAAKARATCCRLRHLLQSSWLVLSPGLSLQGGLQQLRDASWQRLARSRQVHCAEHRHSRSCLRLHRPRCRELLAAPALLQQLSERALAWRRLLLAPGARLQTRPAALAAP